MHALGQSCSSNPCSANYKSCNDTVYGHVCICPDGRYGDNCEKRKS